VPPIDQVGYIPFAHWNPRTLALSLEAGLRDYRVVEGTQVNFALDARSLLNDPEGIVDVKEALWRSLALGHGHLSALLYNNLADLLERSEGSQRALDLYNEGIEFSMRRGLLAAVTIAQSGAASTLYRLGRWDEA
jgi:hypothetical protein